MREGRSPDQAKQEIVTDQSARSAVTKLLLQFAQRNVLRGMGLAHLVKNAKAIKELSEKGMAPD